MQFKRTSEKYNALVGRKEVAFEIEHLSKGTPSRLDIAAELAAQFGGKKECVVLRKITTKRGTSTAVGYAEIYDQPDKASLFTPEYIGKRSLPKEKS